MTVKGLLKLSFRSILRNKMRSLLTSLGIIIGVGSVIIMVAVGEGSQQQIEKQIQSLGSNLIMVFPERGPDKANRMTTADTKKLRNEASYLKAVSGTTRKSFTVIGGSGDWETTVYGVESDYLDIKQRTIKDGSFFSERDISSKNKIAVIGATIADNLFEYSNPIGMQIRINKVPFTITGILDSKGNTGTGTDQDDMILVPLDTALTRLQNSRYIDTIEMSVVSENLMDQAESEIEEILRESHRLADSRENDFRIMNQAEIISTVSSTAKTLTVLLGAIAGVSLIVGGIGIMNIMLVSVTERTREIGIRMSVGARKKDILLQFLSESIILSLLGGFMGIVSAAAIALSLDSFFNIPAVIKPEIIFLSAGFAAAVGIFFGYYPAKSASNLYPIDALRHE